jgi:TP53 regulating kinase and related kinases
MESRIIQRGAEAIILKEKNKITKKRIKKSYRIPELDKKIRKLRTRSETKLLIKASKIINTPQVHESDEKTKEIKMDFIKGERLSEFLNNFQLKRQLKILLNIGKDIAKLHDAEIIHGDLTTSNMILAKNNSLTFIDFGLGFISHKFEDKAVDIHLLRQALEAKHFQHWEKLFKEFLKGYKKSKDYAKTLERFKAVEKRGRYKH